MGREERSRRAVEAAVSLARENRLRVEEPVVLNDLFSLMVHLRPAPVVARVATCMPKVRKPISAWLEREIAVTTFLSERGAPVVAPSRELPPGPHERDGFPISFWEYVEPDPNRTPTAADCSAMLVDLHEVLRSYPGELPMLGAGDDIPRMMEELDPASDILSAADENLLRASAERLRPFWETLSGDIQPIHGDAHSGNLIAAREGGLVWIDFEDVCRGLGRVGSRDDDGRRSRLQASQPRFQSHGEMHRASDVAGGVEPHSVSRRLPRHQRLERRPPEHARHPRIPSRRHIPLDERRQMKNTYHGRCHCGGIRLRDKENDK